MADRDELDWIKEHEPWRLSEKPEPEKLPTEKWTEPEIEDWIEANGLPIKYDIRNKTKKWALGEIKKYLSK